ncbi:MAG: OmpH family outer membrane protein [Verrucomicrobiia bacterium]
MSTKKSAVLMAVCGLALATAVWAEGPSGRIVTVDMSRLFNEYYKTPIASKKLQETAEGFNKEQETMLTEYRALNDELVKLREDAEKSEYTSEAKELKRKAVTDKLTDIQKAQRDIEEFRRIHQKSLMEQTDRMKTNVLKEINDAISKVARDNGYLMVFDKSGKTLNEVPSIVFSQDTMDVTDDILKVLNKNAPKTEP